MLTVTRGRLAGKTLPVGAGPFSIGAGAACTLQLDGEGVSQQHACIKVQEGVVILEDLDSISGLHLNGQQVRRQPLKPGDVIRIGNNEMLVHL